MYAVIETGGKQYRVSEGDVITVEKLKVEIDSEIAFDKVLLIGDAGNVEVGTPYLDAARVFGSVVDAGKGKKVIIFKYKAKKDYRKKQGHRQPYTSIRIDAISADGKPVAKKTVAKVNDAAKTKEAEETAVLTETVEQAAEKAVEKKPAEKKPAAKKAESAEKKPAAKKTEEKKPATAKKNAAAETEKQPVAEKPVADVPGVEDVKTDVEKTAEKAE